MKVIGINGFSCSGKSTLANMIKEQDPENIEIIKIDFLLDNKPYKKM